MVEAATLAHRDTGVTTEHEASITDTALTADGFTAHRGGEARATHRAGVTTELVVAVGRALEGCGERTRRRPPFQGSASVTVCPGKEPFCGF